MNERGLKVLEQYEFKVLSTRRGRGSFLCETDQGLKIIMEFQGTGKKLAFQNHILEKLKEQGYRLVDTAVLNAQGEFVTKDRDETAYVVKDWFEGRECDTKSEEDILLAVRNLACLHKLLCVRKEALPESYIGEKLGEEYGRHNREIKKTWYYIKERRQKNPFERSFLEHYSRFMEQAQEASRLLEKSAYETLYEKQKKEGKLCHGDYNQHQILFTRKGIATTNFSRCRYDIQTGDLYQFMRKILEKQNWNPELGQKMLEEYNRSHYLSKEGYEYLKIRLSYPEKFWKLANHYYNHNKAWIPGKNVEKLQMLVNQQGARDAFLKILDL